MALRSSFVIQISFPLIYKTVFDSHGVSELKLPSK
jgi:hypothetical protein